MNAAEYDNTVAELLGTSLRPGENFPDDGNLFGFDNVSEALTLSTLLLEAYELAATALVDELLFGDGGPDPTVVSCDVETADCAGQLLTDFASRAWRRPTNPDEIEGLLGLMSDSSLDALAAPLTAILLSHHFLFRVESGQPAAPGERPRLTDHELASRLSYFLWSGMPDGRLFELAEGGALHDPDVIAQQVRRMLADGRAIALTDNLAGQWLRIRDVVRHFGELGGEGFLDLLVSMAVEMRLFFESFVDDGRDMRELLTATTSWVDAPLATHYDLPGVEGDGFIEVDVSSIDRGGVLTMAGFLTVTSGPLRSSPVRRGFFVLDALLCDTPPPPPPGVEGFEREAPDDTESLRTRLERHRADPRCAGCHLEMDEIGFALEHFDHVGVWRDEIDGSPVDATGELDGRPFDGALELSAVMVEDERLARCMVRKVFTYALGREPGDLDREALVEIERQFIESGWRFEALAIALATSEPFTHVHPRSQR